MVVKNCRVSIRVRPVCRQGAQEKSEPVNEFAFPMCSCISAPIPAPRREFAAR